MSGKDDRGRRWGMVAAFALVAALVGILAFLLARNVGLERATPPIEVLTFERIELPRVDLIRVHVVNGGVDPVTVHQVVVDDAVWSFTITPDPTVGRLRHATIEIPYPWVEGEAHHLRLISRNGITFDTEIAVATETPTAGGGWILRLALLGLYVGILPVSLGLGTYPFLKRLGERGVDFLLALTVGLLVFLAVDTLVEARELAGEVARGFHAPVLVWLLALATTVGLLALTARRRARRGTISPITLSFLIALGIGLHNLGEGLAIGAALAAGSVGLGTFLVVGFTLHNITEGVGIAAPMLRAEPGLAHFTGLAALAGGPAVLGAWIGGLVFDPLWSSVFLSVGAGAILQVVVEVGRLLAGRTEGAGGMWRGEVLGGGALGLLLMYATALIVPA